jgi:hypothetical protein
MAVKASGNTSKKPSSTTGRSLDEFRASHDKNFIVPTKIREALVLLGPEGWDYELAFMKLAGISTTDLAQFRDQFEAHVVDVGAPRAPKRVWAGSVALAKKLRGML